MVTPIVNRKSSVIENLHVVMGFIRAVCPTDNVLSWEQGKFLAGMVSDAIEEIEANKKRIDHLEEYKAGWLSTVNVVNKTLHPSKAFGEHDFIRVADYLESLSTFHTALLTNVSQSEYFYFGSDPDKIHGEFNVILVSERRKYIDKYRVKSDPSNKSGAK